MYWRWGRIKLLYKVHSIGVCWYPFSLFMIPSDLDILFAILLTCPLHVMISSRFKPRKFNSFTRSICWPFNVITGIYCPICCWWWKIMNVVFSVFKDNLFISNILCWCCSITELCWNYLIRLTLTHWPLGDFTEILDNLSFKLILVIDGWCSQMNATEPHWWKINIGSGNGLVPSGNKPLPEPMLTQIYVAIWLH